jgi:cobalt-zinc-cadmium resistance protein CzcA
VGAIAFCILAGFAATRLGSEFVPSLDEGDIALHALRIPGTSLEQSIKMQHQLETTIKTVPEVEHVFAKIGTAEIATDPMPPSVADGYVILKPRTEWPDPRKAKSQLVAEIEALTRQVPGNNYEYTQPIQMRFNELIAGVRSDVAIKVFGDDSAVLFEQAEQIKSILEQIDGASDVKVEQVTGLPMISIKPDRAGMARWGLNVSDVQQVVRMAYAGEEVSRYFEGDRNFPVVIRLHESDRHNIASLGELPIALPEQVVMHRPALEAERASLRLESPDKPYVTLKEVAEITTTEGPNQISRENGKRRVVVTANIRERDLGSFVTEAQSRIHKQLSLPAHYWLGWGGQYEHLISARARLMIVVPVVLVSVFALVLFTFKSLRYALLVYTGIPFALSGGVLALWLRGIPFSISAAVGFIALSGVSVLNGLVLVSFTRGLLEKGEDALSAVVAGAASRLRPVLMTALVASLGFIPMAISQGTGSEVQRPLATVVIGGIISSTFLTLVVLPILLLIFRNPLSKSLPASLVKE